MASMIQKEANHLLGPMFFGWPAQPPKQELIRLYCLYIYISKVHFFVYLIPKGWEECFQDATHDAFHISSSFPSTFLPIFGVSIRSFVAWLGWVRRRFPLMQNWSIAMWDYPWQAVDCENTSTKVLTPREYKVLDCNCVKMHGTTKTIDDGIFPHTQGQIMYSHLPQMTMDTNGPFM